MKQAVRYGFVVGLILLAVAASAQEEQQEPTEMKEIVVKDEAINPSRVRVTNKKLEEKQAHDLEDTFRGTADVTVGGGQSAAEKIYVRGIEDTNLNVTVDNARQSGYLFHHQGRLSIDPELIKQVEVDAGTGGALAGPGALGGAVRFETKDASDLLKPGRQYGALAKARYNTNDDEKGFSAGVFGKPTDVFGFLIYGNFADSGDYRAGGGDYVANTAAKPLSGLMKLTYTPDQTQKLTYSGNYKEDNAYRALRSHFGPSASNVPRDQKYHNLTHALNYDLAANSNVNLHANVYDTVTELKHETDTSSSRADMKSVGASVANSVERSWVTWTTGLDFSNDVANADGATRTARETSKIYGAFTQGAFTVGDRWKLITGLRYDQYVLTDVVGEEIKRDHVSPSAKAQYQWNDVFMTYASYTQAFKGPVPMEIFIMSNATSMTTAEGLQGTTGETYELGNEAAFNNQKIALVGYYTAMHDPISSSVNRTTGAATRTNTPDIVSQGATLSWSGHFNELSSGVSYAHNEIKSDGQPLGYVAFNKGASYGDRINVSFDYQLPAQKVTLGWDSLIAMKLTSVPEGAEDQPGYDVHDISATWKKDDSLSVGLSLQNIFDKKYVAQGTPYFATGSSMYEPGRDLRTTVTYLF